MRKRILPYVYSDSLRFRGETGSISPSPLKAGLVTEEAFRQGISGKFLLEVPGEPASIDQLAMAHSTKYVESVLELQEPNGFGNTDYYLTRHAQYSVAAMVRACQLAVGYRTIACAPVSGFHHAHYSNGGGFCTFNGLVVAARLSGAGKVGIIDCDYHYGDGTEAIIKRLGLQDRILHWSAGFHFKEPKQANSLLLQLPKVIREMVQKGVELIIYQAGADQHVDDPLGGLLTTTEMDLRDRLVFNWAYNISGVPVAFNFAGGYQEPIEEVVTLHINTLKAAVHALNDTTLVEAL